MGQLIAGLQKWIMAAGLIWVAAGAANAEDRGKPAALKLLIAVPQFSTRGSQAADLAVRIRLIVEEKLSHLECCEVSNVDWSAVQWDSNDKPELSIWLSRQVLILVLGRITTQDNGSLKIDAGAWDVVTDRQLTGWQFSSSPAEWQQTAGIIADHLVAYLGQRNW